MGEIWETLAKGGFSTKQYEYTPRYPQNSHIWGVGKCHYPKDRYDFYRLQISVIFCLSHKSQEPIFSKELHKILRDHKGVSASAAVTKYHLLGCLNNRKLLLPIFGIASTRYQKIHIVYNTVLSACRRSLSHYIAHGLFSAHIQRKLFIGKH